MPQTSPKHNNKHDSQLSFASTRVTDSSSDQLFLIMTQRRMVRYIYHTKKILYIANQSIVVSKSFFFRPQHKSLFSYHIVDHLYVRQHDLRTGKAFIMPFHWKVCLVDDQTQPYQYFGHKQMFGSCLDSCQNFGKPIIHDQLQFILLPTQAKSWASKTITKILASQIFGEARLG